jgi:HK97 family phage portal protein
MWSPFSKAITGSQANIAEKNNPAQPILGGTIETGKEPTFIYQRAYETLEIVNRGVNMIVDDACQIPVRVGEQYPGDSVVKGVKKSKVDKRLNWQPNPYQDINTFRRNLLTDMILDGNIFIYWDGAYLYHQPANKMVIHSSKTSYIKKYTFNEQVNFKPSEIIHIKENSFTSIYRGTSRLKPARRTMELMTSMRNFQDNFFKNGAVPGLVLKSPNTLSQKIKDRLIASWQEKYRPGSGGKRPLVLDGGLEIDEISKINFKDLDFQSAIDENEDIILKALGVPPILLDSGNNANLRPNMRMYYLETVLPIVRKINSGYERFFGFHINEDTTDIPALQPELSDQSNYYSSLVNVGIITANEARDKLGFEEDKDPESDKLRIPANIAGSAADPNDGGRPEEGDDKK